MAEQTAPQYLQPQQPLYQQQPAQQMQPQQPLYQQQPVQPQQIQPMAYPQNVPLVPTTSILGLNIQDSQFWKGALIGAAVTMLVTSESVQKGVVTTISKVTAAAQSGIEEMKEKLEDAKAEAQAETAE